MSAERKLHARCLALRLEWNSRERPHVEPTVGDEKPNLEQQQANTLAHAMCVLDRAREEALKPRLRNPEQPPASTNAVAAAQLAKRALYTSITATDTLPSTGCVYLELYFPVPAPTMADLAESHLEDWVHNMLGMTCCFGPKTRIWPNDANHFYYTSGLDPTQRWCVAETAAAFAEHVTHNPLAWHIVVDFGSWTVFVYGANL